MEKYFNRRFKTLRGVKIAIFIKRIYDWFRLTRDGEKILSQQYGISGNVYNNKQDYTIMNLIMTANMIYDISQYVAKDITSEMEEQLVKEIETQITRQVKEEYEGRTS